MSADYADGGGQYLSFLLDEEVYAVAVESIREIVEYTGVTKVPHMPQAMCGVMNLRGSVISVVDLRARFGLEPTPITIDTCVVVIDLHLDNERSVVGLLVDSVDEVFELGGDELVPAPKMGTRVPEPYIAGIANRESGLTIVLDIHRLFNDDEVEELRAAG